MPFPTEGEPTTTTISSLARLFAVSLLISSVAMAQTAPPNDLCTDAIPVGVGQSVTGSTSNATFDDVGTCGTTNTAPGTWYTVVGTGNTMTVSTCNAGSNFDTKLTVLCDDCDELNCVGGNDDSCSGFSALLSTVNWCSEAGRTYHVLVHGFGQATGTYQLDVLDGGSACGTPTGACVTQIGPQIPEYFPVPVTSTIGLMILLLVLALAAFRVISTRNRAAS